VGMVRAKRESEAETERAPSLGVRRVLFRGSLRRIYCTKNCHI